MKPIQRVERSRSIKPSISSPKAGSNRSYRHTTGSRPEDGESIRVKVLDHLGGGKLIIDLKGERMVANTLLPLEKNQEIDVIVRNAGSKIILQLLSDSHQSINPEQPAALKSTLGNIISQLISSLQSAEAAKLSTLVKPDALDTVKELMQEVQELVSSITVKVTEGDLAQQIQNAVNALGYDYEHKLADALTSDRPSMGNTPMLKAGLMQLRSILSENVLQDRGLQTALLESIDSILESIEFQQVKSMLYSERFQHLYFQIPFLSGERTATAQVEFFRPKRNRKGNDNSFSIILSFDLERLGYMEFVISVMDKHINCQIKADEYETYELAKGRADELEGMLTALGYNVGGIHCTITDSETRARQLQQTLLNQMVMDDIDIIV